MNEMTLQHICVVLIMALKLLIIIYVSTFFFSSVFIGILAVPIASQAHQIRNAQAEGSSVFTPRSETDYDDWNDLHRREEAVSNKHIFSLMYNAV